MNGAGKHSGYNPGMQTYLVGGAVRDRLLGLPVRERDWVVVGATPADMEARGFRRVGRSFPVYLHPDTGEEYALARTERKTAPGYHGFEVVADPTVTLEQDLHRRDLTINAMAEDLSGRIIDPWGGQEHLRSRVLHHVSAAFAEDPVRILRVARFAARFHALDFTVAPATLELMTGMVRAGETGALQSERVWQETEKALGESRPDTYFRVLRDCGALATVFPELDALFGVPQPPRWHPEIDTGIHILMAVREAARRGYDTAVRFAVLVHDLGKGTTPPGEWPKHRGHEQRSAVLVRQLCTRLSVPNRFRDLAIPVALHHGLCHRAFELRPQTILHLLEDVDAFRRPERLEAFLDACECDARGRTGLEDQAYPQRELLRSAFEAAREVDAAGIAAGGLAGEQLREAIRAARRAAISELRQRFPPAPEAVTARPADPG